jgi:dTDP-glucose 4,6-dehydratase
MKFLILGSNSFSGSSFINYLLNNEKSAKIFALSRSKEYHSALLPYKNNTRYKDVSFFQYNLNNDIDKIVELIYDEKIRYIINFAAQGMVAQSWDNPAQWFKTNSISLVSLIDKIYRFDFIEKFVQISTPEVYGNCYDKKESMCFLPSSPYGASKASADLALYCYFKTHKFPVNFTRSSNVYGPYQQLYRIIPKTIITIKKNKKLYLDGGGRAKRNFIYIDDVSRAILTIAKEAKIGEVYHISDKEIISIYDLVALICKLMDTKMSDLVEVTKDRVSQDSLYFLNSEKLQRDFGLKPKVKLIDGIKLTIEWLDKNFNDLKNFPDFYIHKE